VESSPLSGTTSARVSQPLQLGDPTHHLVPVSASIAPSGQGYGITATIFDATTASFYGKKQFMPNFGQTLVLTAPGVQLGDHTHDLVPISAALAPVGQGVGLTATVFDATTASFYGKRQQATQTGATATLPLAPVQLGDPTHHVVPMSADVALAGLDYGLTAIIFDPATATYFAKRQVATAPGSITAIPLPPLQLGDPSHTLIP
jgi:hypothetical protein